MCHLPEITDENVIIGTKTADDAAVYRLSDEVAIVQTLDYFPPVVDDPYHYGAIAAANSLSDVYAMGARPLFALNVVGFPRGSVPLEVLGEILRGGAEKAAEAGIAIVGGHTIDDAEPKYGLSVTGIVHPQRVLANVGARVGDRLVLTKPLGSGIATTAMKRDACPPELAERAIAVMETLNRPAAEVASAVGVNACTDVTGFGFLGHLREMTVGSAVGARIHLGAVPVLDGVLELAEAGCVAGGTLRNGQSLRDAVRWPDPSTSLRAGIPEAQKIVLYDAQTSGGLLLAVPEDRTQDLCRRLAEAGVEAAVVGEIIEDPTGCIEVVR